MNPCPATRPAAGRFAAITLLFALAGCGDGGGTAAAPPVEPLPQAPSPVAPAPAAPAAPQGSLLAQLHPPLLYAPARDACPERDVTRHYSLPTVNEAAAGTQVTSECLTVAGLPEGEIATLHTLRGSYSVNETPFVPASTRTPVRNGDRLRFRLQASTVANEERLEDLMLDFADGRSSIRQWAVRTRNDVRSPRLWQVGPGRPHREISEVAGQLAPGDTVEVDPGEYGPVRLRRTGAAEAPIVIRGVGPGRPVIRGTSDDVYQATFHFENVHHYLLENVEIDGGGGTRTSNRNAMCVRLMGHVLVLRNVRVRGCPRHGILGSDLYSGTVVLDRVEVADAGAPATDTENGKHPVYVATDRDRYPGAVLRVQNSFIHSFEGGGIKSRSERNEIYFNWIETKAQRPAVGVERAPVVLYTLELYGYEEYENAQRLDSDVVANVLVHRNALGLRLGGDGTGASRGRVRLAHNTVVLPADFGDAPVLRLFHGLDAVYLLNNVFVAAGNGPQGPRRMFRDDLRPQDWLQGTPRVAGLGNWFGAHSELRLFSGAPEQGSPLAQLAGSRQGTANPGLAALADLEALDLSVRSGSELAGQAAPADAGPPQHAIPAALLDLPLLAPPRRPVPGAALPATPRPPGPRNIGAL